MDTQTQFGEIDHALLSNDIKRAEVAIARFLRRKNSTQERAELLFRRAQTRLLSARPDDALEDLETGLALQPDLVLLVYVVNDIEPTHQPTFDELCELLGANETPDHENR